MLGAIVEMALGLLIAGVIRFPAFMQGPYLDFLIEPWAVFLTRSGFMDQWQAWRWWIGWGLVVHAFYGLRHVLLWPIKHAYWFRRIFGGRIFGQARWAKIRDLRKAGTLKPGGLFLGRVGGLIFGRDIYHNGEGHLITIAGAGGGKSAGLVVPTLLTLTEGSVIITDPSGELAAITSRRRAEIGPVVFLNPFAATFSKESGLSFPDTGFNPLSVLDPKSPDFMTDVNAFARLLMVTDRKDSGSYWNDEGAEFLALMIAALILYFHRDLHHLSFLYEMVRDSPDNMLTQLEMIMDKRHPALMSEAERFHSIIAKAPPQWAGISSKAALATKRYAPTTPLGEHTKKDGFDTATLKTQKVSVYVLVPSSMLATALPWLNLLTGVFGSAIGKPGPRAPVTMLIDEAPALGFLPDLIGHMAQFRKAGLRVWLFSQTYAALAADELYGRTGMQTIMGLTKVKQFFAVEEPETQELVSKLCGQKSVSNPSTTGNMGDVGQPLIRPDEVRGLPKWHQIIIRGELLFPVYAKLIPYFNRKAWIRVADRNPYRGPV